MAEKLVEMTAAQLAKRMDYGWVARTVVLWVDN